MPGRKPKVVGCGPRTKRIVASDRHSSRIDAFQLPTLLDEALALLEEELERERRESSQSIATLEADLVSQREVRAELQELLRVRDEAGAALEREAAAQSRETEAVVGELNEELRAHQEASAALTAELEQLNGHVSDLEPELERQRASASEAIEALEADLAGHKGSQAEMSASYAEQLEAAAVVEAIHASSGLAVLAHPARYRLGFKPLMRAASALGFDGAECWYDYEMQPQWRPSPLICEHKAALASDLNLLQSCGTDSHGISLKGR